MIPFRITPLLIASAVLLLSALPAFSSTFTVTKVADASDGVCDADCSLREAIEAANSAPSDDVIEFDAGVFSTRQTIAMSGSEFVIAANGSLTINGIGVHLTVISGVDSNGTFEQRRVFRILPSAVLVLNELTVSGGNATSGTFDGFGGSFYVDQGTLTTNDVRISGFASAGGGGIFNENGTVTLNRTEIWNARTQGAGGGIYNNGGTLSMTSSSVTLCDASSNGGGGGLFNAGAATIDSSMFWGNRALSGQSGGGIKNMVSASLTNSTVSTNLSFSGGGGIHNQGNLSLGSSTIADNNVLPGKGVRGGGIFNEAGGAASAHNTIVARNVIGQSPQDSGALPSDFVGILDSGGYNILGEASAVTITGETTGNQLNTDPLLSLAASAYGGPTLSYALKQGSPAIDAGDPDSFPPTDQRGQPRALDGDGNGSVLPDVGAYETSNITEPSEFVVTNIDGSGPGSLRHAIESSNATFGSDTINFDPSTFSVKSVIDLNGRRLEIAPEASVVINGPGADLVDLRVNDLDITFYVLFDALFEIAGVTVSDSQTAIFSVNGSITLRDSVVRDGRRGLQLQGGTNEITNTVISGNSGGTSGTGIRSFASNTTISNSSISDNRLLNPSSSSCGAGLLNIFGEITIRNSTISGNSTVVQGRAAGLCNTDNGTISLTNSTVSHNISADGGGIYNQQGTVQISNSTIAFNTGWNTGGVWANGPVSLRNTIVANNSGTNLTGNDILGMIESQGYNLIRDPSGATINGDTTGNILNTDPLLDPFLRSNGSPTKTHGLNPASPAIDSGDRGGNDTDQRGFIRPFDFAQIANVSDGSDIGAFERQFNEGKFKALFDFDGDGATDVSVFRPNSQPTAQWWLLRSSDSGTRGLAFGSSTDVPVAADFTGDGRTDVAFWRPSTGEWFILRSEDDSFFAFPFGANGDIPAPGDFDGDGKADPAVYRPSSGTWFIVRSSDGGLSVVPFGVAADQPIVADYDGDGKDDIGVYRAPDNQFWLLRSTDGVKAFQFGAPGDRTTVGDWTGDGMADVAFFRPSTSKWYVIRSEDDSFFAFPWGATGDIPSPGDFDGDGTFDPAVWRPSDRTWYIFGTTSGFEAVQFGSPGDVPLPSSVSVN